MSHNSLYILINESQRELKDSKLQSPVLWFFPFYLLLSQSSSSKKAVKTSIDQPCVN